MAASNRSTNSSPSTGKTLVDYSFDKGSVKVFNMVEKDMVDRLSTEKSVLQHQDTNNSFLRPLSGTTGNAAFSASSNTDSFHIRGYENAADTTRSYHSNTDFLSFEEVYPSMRYEDMFYHGNRIPSGFQRPSNSNRNQLLPQYNADDASYFAPFHSSNQQYPVPEPIHASPEFHMFQTNSTLLDRHANKRTDYMMRSAGKFGLRNITFGETKLNPFTGRKTFLPMPSTRRSMEHPSSADLSANDFDMGQPHRVLRDDFESAASLSYREQQANNRSRRGSFSASSSSPSSIWELDYNLPPFDESRSGSCSDFYHRPASSDLLTERNRAPRSSSRPNGKSKMITDAQADRSCQQDLLSQFRDAKFFVIKSYSEDNVYKSIKYCVWASTKNGNKKLDAAYREAKTKEVPCSVFLLFSVNASAQFCGVAEMVGPVDFDTSVEYWQQDRWSGHFPVKWLIVKDVPNSLFRHIIIEDNDNKPVTNSRDTQEVGLEQGIEMLNIFNSCEMKSSMLDDFSFYEERQRAAQERKARQHAVLENLRVSSLTSVPTYHTSTLHEDYVREMSKSFAEALALQHKLN